MAIQRVHTPFVEATFRDREDAARAVTALDERELLVAVVLKTVIDPRDGRHRYTHVIARAADRRARDRARFVLRALGALETRDVEGEATKELAPSFAQVVSALRAAWTRRAPAHMTWADVESRFVFG